MPFGHPSKAPLSELVVCFAAAQFSLVNSRLLAAILSAIWTLKPASRPLTWLPADWLPSLVSANVSSSDKSILMGLAACLSHAMLPGLVG
jgi:hypothetical protein